MCRIIVGVKYCFRYNARNRALARGETGEPIDLETMPRPHRRRREKKLMTMDEVNERFPLTKYKAWMATRASEGLPTAGGVAATPSRAASLRDADGAMPSSPTSMKHPVEDRPATAASVRPSEKTNPANPTTEGETSPNVEGDAKTHVAAEAAPPMPALAEVNTTATFDKDKAEDEEDDEDHIHDALPPELLTTPGDTCAICIDAIEEDDDIRGLTCGHAFHASCLDPWLTSRRACCPLCKADYYIPKPRPEGEAAEAERPRRTGRLAMPQQPPSAWTGIRGNPRMMFPGRFMSSPMYPGDGYSYPQPDGRRARRAQRDTQEQSQSLESPQAPTADESNTTPSNHGFASRLRSANPFSTRWMSPMRLPTRSSRQDAAPVPEPPTTQLEEVVVR
jgi:hypothetical protein